MTMMRDLRAALVHCYPDKVWAHLGIRADWSFDTDGAIVLTLEDDYGRKSMTRLTEKTRLAGRVPVGSVLAEKIDKALEWHLEPPPFWVD